jgi:eukaryotic-like serine/threonine-protein kinase
MAEDVFGIVGTVQAGAFRVEQVVAEGGFAVVYRAHHEAFRAKVALKCLKVPGTLSAEHQREFLERFREEAELLFRLSASIATVVRPLHVGTLDGKAGLFAPFMAIEWLEGRTLDKIIAQRRADGLAPLGLKDVVRLLGPVAHALERAHHFPTENGEVAILHRDLKPENVFVANVHGAEVVKILDFGIGKVKSAASQIAGKLSADGGALSAFTPAYGAPEQWLPRRFGQTGPWTDVWGFALCLVEACTGRPPLEGDQAAILGSAIDELRRPTPRADGVETSDAVETIFRKALAVSPERRYHDVGAFFRDLTSALGLETTELQPTDARAALKTELVPPAAVGRRARDPLAGTLPSAVEARLAPTERPAPAELVVPDLVVASARRAARPGAPDRRESAPRISLASGYGGDRGTLDDTFSSETGLPATRASPRAVALDPIGLAPVPARALRASAREAASSIELGRRAASVSRLKDRLRSPVKLVLIGCAVMVLDYAYAAVTGESLALGPVRPFWIAAPFVLVGLGMAFLRLFASED